MGMQTNEVSNNVLKIVAFCHIRSIIDPDTFAFVGLSASLYLHSWIDRYRYIDRKMCQVNRFNLSIVNSNNQEII